MTQPLIQLRRDFHDSNIILASDQTATINDRDLITIMEFYRSELIPGSLLSIGAGTTHFFYMSALEDKLSHITAVDLSPSIIKVLRNIFSLLKNPKQEANGLTGDIRRLKVFAEAVAKNGKFGHNRSKQKILGNLIAKFQNSQGNADFIVGDMYEIDKIVNRKFNNVLFGFSLFIGNDLNDLTKLFEKVRKILAGDGKIVIADFTNYRLENMKKFPEDEVVLEKYTAVFPLTAKVLTTNLEKAGFSDIKINEVSPKEASEKNLGLKYIFASAKNR